jgi:hypothetical protein
MRCESHLVRGVIGIPWDQGPLLALVLVYGTTTLLEVKKSWSWLEL